MEKRCVLCRCFAPVPDPSVYLKEFDGHCVINGDLVYGDDVCEFFELSD